MMNRRDILKYFSAGTVIGAVGSGIEAKLIETPKVEIIERLVVPVMALENVIAIAVTLELKDGTHHTFRSRQMWHGEGQLYPGSHNFSLTFNDYSSPPAGFAGRLTGDGTL